MKNKVRDLPVFVINHQDLTWRRCFDRPLEFRGESFVSYAHLQKLYILENLKNAREHPEYKFMIECVATPDCMDNDDLRALTVII